MRAAEIATRPFGGNLQVCVLLPGHVDRGRQEAGNPESCTCSRESTECLRRCIEDIDSPGALDMDVDKPRGQCTAFGIKNLVGLQGLLRRRDAVDPTVTHEYTAKS